MKTVKDIVSEVFSRPTAPYRESWVLQYVRGELARMKIPFFADTWGNIFAGVSSQSALKNSHRVGLVAHTDHPGFHLVKRKGPLWVAQWFGGRPPKTHGAAVAVYHPAYPGRVAKGLIHSRQFFGKEKNKFLINITPTAFASKLDETCFGAFDYSGYKIRGPRVFTRAADDLTGVAIILATLERLKASERRQIFGVFTRAEEVGFRGTLGIIYKNTVGPKNSIISLEASRTLSGARIGLGPVIRLGDKRTLFDSTVTSRLDQAAARLQSQRHGRRPKFRFQRRIMNGGTCEATPFNLHGIRASGIAVPLGNYHNQRPNGRPGPEFIDIRDVEAAMDLCVEFYRQMARMKDPVGEFLATLKKEFGRDEPYLRERIHFEERGAD